MKNVQQGGPRGAPLRALVFALGVMAAPAFAQGEAQTSVMPQITDLAGLEIGMTTPPLPAPLEWMGGSCFGTEGEEVCAKGYNLLTGTAGAYVALTTGYSAGRTADGEALWTLADLIALPFATSDRTFYAGPECEGGTPGTTPVLFFNDWPENGTDPKPIWGAEIHLTTAMITLVEDLSVYHCVFEEP